MNNCTLRGRAGRDAELRTSAGGSQVAKFSLAVNRTRKDKTGQYPTDWFDVICFGKLAEVAAERIRKGQDVIVAGSVEIEKWTDQNGGQRTSVQVNARDFQLINPPKRDEAPASTAAATDNWDDSTIPSW